MKVAVLSDIHGNLEAFEAVTSDIQRRGADRVVCLGDNIGYGPDPEEVVRQIRELEYVSILGNHEFALLDIRARRWMNFQAAENNVATAKLLSEENLAYCCTLPKYLAINYAYFVHGFPPASLFRYLNRQPDERLAALFATASFSLYFLGHTHKLELVRQEQEVIVRRPLGEERLELQPGETYVINAGSVGQPRDGDNCAKYLFWDMAEASLEVHFIPYDYRTTMEKIRAMDFPDAYAARLG
ncbi:MAG: metallophosphoesterase family protein [Pseudomonadota bacterium]